MSSEFLGDIFNIDFDMDNFSACDLWKMAFFQEKEVFSSFSRFFSPGLRQWNSWRSEAKEGIKTVAVEELEGWGQGVYGFGIFEDVLEFHEMVEVSEFKSNKIL